MRTPYRKYSFALTILFFIGMLATVYFLLNLSESLEKTSGIVDLNALTEMSPVLNNLYWIIGITLLIGMGAVLSLFYQMNNAVEAVESGNSRDGALDSEQHNHSNGDEEEKVKEQRAQSILSEISKIKDEHSKSEKTLSRLCMTIEASQGILYQAKKTKGKRYIEMLTSFAFTIPESEKIKYEFGEGLAGQVAKEGKKINISDIPEGYVNILSGLGISSPSYLAIIPLMKNKEVVGVAEIASFKEISSEDEQLISSVFSDFGQNAEVKNAPADKKAKPEVTAKQ